MSLVIAQDELKPDQVKNPAASGGALKPKTNPTADQSPHDDAEYTAVSLPP